MSEQPKCEKCHHVSCLTSPHPGDCIVCVECIQYLNILMIKYGDL